MTNSSMLLTESKMISQSSVKLPHIKSIRKSLFKVEAQNISPIRGSIAPLDENSEDFQLRKAKVNFALREIEESRHKLVKYRQVSHDNTLNESSLTPIQPETLHKTSKKQKR